MQPSTIIGIEPCKGEIFLAPYEAVRNRGRIQVLAEFLPSKAKIVTKPVIHLIGVNCNLQSPVFPDLTGTCPQFGVQSIRFTGKGAAHRYIKVCGKI